MKLWIFPMIMGIALGACGVSVVHHPVQFFVLMIIAATWGNWK